MHADLIEEGLALGLGQVVRRLPAGLRVLQDGQDLGRHVRRHAVDQLQPLLPNVVQDLRSRRAEECQLLCNRDNGKGAGVG